MGVFSSFFVYLPINRLRMKKISLLRFLMISSLAWMALGSLARWQPVAKPAPSRHFPVLFSASATKPIAKSPKSPGDAWSLSYMNGFEDLFAGICLSFVVSCLVNGFILKVDFEDFFEVKAETQKRELSTWIQKVFAVIALLSMLLGWLSIDKGWTKRGILSSMAFTFALTWVKARLVLYLLGVLMVGGLIFYGVQWFRGKQVLRHPRAKQPGLDGVYIRRHLGVMSIVLTIGLGFIVFVGGPTEFFTEGGNLFLVAAVLFLLGSMALEYRNFSQYAKICHLLSVLFVLISGAAINNKDLSLCLVLSPLAFLGLQAIIWVVGCLYYRSIKRIRI